VPQNTAPLISWRGEHARIPLPLRILGRYFITGRKLYGPGDNATFLHRATVDYRARPYLTLTGPIWQRLARRHAAFTMPGLLLAAAPWWTLWPLMLYLLALTGLALWWAARSSWRGVKNRRRNRAWIDPAARVACSVLGMRYTRRMGRAMVELPAGWGEGDERGDPVRQTARITIPAGTALTKTLRASFTDNVGARLGIPKPVQADWSEGGASVFVELSAAPTPPKSVTWASMQRAVAAADEDTLVLGRTASGHLATVSLAEDAPHIALSGASGTGKSVLARVMLAPRVEAGDGLIITDPKKFSHWRWAGGGKVDKRRIRYAWRTEELHEAWLEIAAEITRRIELDEDELAGQRRVFILVEEINTQTKRLQRHWRAERKRIIVAAKLALADDPAADIDLGDLDPPVQSPAIVAMQEAVAMGRELRMHVVVAAQRLSASVFGGNGGDIRESFQGGRLIAKWDRRLWKMLVDTIDYVACPSGPRGIWGLARGDTFEILRVPFLSEADALDMVTSSACPVSGHVLGQQDSPGHLDMSLDNGQPAIVSGGVTLMAALDMLPGQDGPDSITLEGLRTAARRGGAFPDPLPKPGGGEYGRTEARLYDLDELVGWRSRVLTEAP
jgi:hypothetical protein